MLRGDWKAAIAKVGAGKTKTPRLRVREVPIKAREILAAL